MSQTGGQKAKTRVQLACLISVIVIGAITMTVSIWTTSGNLETQSPLNTQTAQNKTEAIPLDQCANHEREEITLKSEKLELFTELVGVLYGTYGNSVAPKTLRYPINAISPKDANPDALKNLTADLYTLKLRGNRLTTRYFPEMTEPFNNGFNAIMQDINTLSTGNRPTSPASTEQLANLSDERKAQHLRNYNQLLSLIRAEAEKLNTLSQQYNQAHNTNPQQASAATRQHACTPLTERKPAMTYTQ